MTRSEEEMTYGERDRRRLIRSVLRLASPEELLREKEQSLSCGDLFRAECVQELIDSPPPQAERILSVDDEDDEDIRNTFERWQNG